VVLDTIITYIVDAECFDDTAHVERITYIWGSVADTDGSVGVINIGGCGDKRPRGCRAS
jgi:hypothetical protein